MPAFFFSRVAKKGGPTKVSTPAQAARILAWHDFAWFLHDICSVCVVLLVFGMEFAFVCALTPVLRKVTP